MAKCSHGHRNDDEPHTFSGHYTLVGTIPLITIPKFRFLSWYYIITTVGHHPDRPSKIWPI